MLKAADAAGRLAFPPFRAMFRSRRPATGINRILVIEPWHIGDVVLVTPFLRALRASQPSAHITLLARKHADELLRHSGLVDEVVVTELPWTEEGNKYPLDAERWRAVGSVVRSLRRRRFDVTVDARIDIRSNLLAAATGAPLRVGYDLGGGGWLLTRALPSERDQTHRLQDWADLLRLIPGSERFAGLAGGPPFLAVSEDEKGRAASALNDALGTGSPTIGYHPGGSHLGKRWPAERFVELITNLQTTVGGRHVLFLGPNENDSVRWPPGVLVIRPALRELMAFTACCDVFVCNDSGPMHIADALGVPVVAIFEIGNPQWFGPSFKRATVIAGERAGIALSAAPLDVPPPNPVSVTCVADAARRTLQSQT